MPPLTGHHQLSAISHWVGYPSDVELAKFLYGTIKRAIMRESRLYRPVFQWDSVSKLRTDFAAAMAARIGNRLHEMVEERPAPVTSDQNALVVLRDAEIKSVMDDLDLGEPRRTRKRTIDPSAAMAGRKAGDAVSLARPVEGRDSVALIGVKQ